MQHASLAFIIYLLAKTTSEERALVYRERDGVDGLGMVFVGFVILDLGVSMGIHILIGELPKK